MISKISKKILILTLMFIVFAATSMFAVKMVANADTELNKDAISAQLTPRRTEYGSAVGDLIVAGNSVYKNYQFGCVTATLGADNSVMSMRDYGGVNYDESSEKLEFLKDISGNYKLESMITGCGVEDDVQETWFTLADKFKSSVSYDPNYALQKICEKYIKLCDEGYNCGIATGNLSVWDNSVIKLDFYDGDSEYGFGEEDGRVHVTTIAYSFLRDEAYAISGKIFNFYKDAKAGSLSEPISDTMPYTENGVKGTVQAFALGYIFYPEGSNKLSVRSSVRYNYETEKFEPLELEFDELTLTDIDDSSLKDSPYYSDFTIAQVKQLFYDKYCELIDSGFNPGIPDHEGIYYWDTELLKQAYVGSDGTGNAWGRTNLMLILNPYDKKVYVVYGEILNIVDKASHGLGNARSLGYPICDPTKKTINGLTYTYQDFYRPYYTENSKSTIYTVEETNQLTRHIVGGYFNEIVASNKKVSANNPKYFYVVEPWIISLICVVPVVLAGAGVAVYFFVFKKRKKATAAAGTAEAVETTELSETEVPETTGTPEVTEAEGGNE